MATIDTNHVGMLIITEIFHLLGLLIPGVPDDCVRKVVFLYSHLSAGYNIGYNVLVWSVNVNPEIQNSKGKSN